ncbi:MAG: ABC transporter permease [Gemmataceae bacterium]
MIFAALTLDREPLRLADLPLYLISWIQSAGGFALVGLLLFYLFGLPRWRPEDRKKVPSWLSSLFVGCTLVALAGYLAFIVATLANVTASARIGGGSIPVTELLHTLGGLAALLAVGLPFFLNVLQLRPRRIFGLAKLSFKEALRRRVLYAFSGMLMVFLFASWYVPSMPKDQVRTYVGVVFLAMSALLLFTAVILASFSLPTDIKQQTIHTIVTKPVQRFEIVLGKFLGFLSLMTLVLVVMTAISLLYILRGIHPEAAAESLKAREWLEGDLHFENTDNEGRGVNVGREWEYRSYITRADPGKEPMIARWDFMDLPASLGSRDQVRCEYTFDVYRTTKGDEGRDVYCTFRFYTWRYKKGNDELYRAERETLRRGVQGTSDIQRENQLAEKYGYYEINSQPVTDFRTQSFVLPGGLFKNAFTSDGERERELQVLREAKVPLRVRVTSDSATQYVGVAKRDLYVRLDEQGTGEQRRFALNFFKGAFGIWLQLALLIGLAVVLSTYLNGVISLLVTAVLFFGGLGREFVQKVASGTNAGGGPVEAMVRISRRELNGPSMADSASISDQIVSKSDTVFRWFIGRIIDMIPDVDRYILTDYVAEGFNIPGSQIFMTVLMLLGYLLPWAVLAYYLIRWREIASST